MKTIISILIVIFGTTGFLVSTKDGDHRTCACTGTFCSCNVSCLDEGELPSCVCGTFSCICNCGPKDAANPADAFPTMSTEQEVNSNKGEGYFRKLGSRDAVIIADGIKALRDAIKSGDVNKYQTNSTLVETTYSRLPESQKTAWENWSEQNLKK